VKFLLRQPLPGSPGNGATSISLLDKQQFLAEFAERTDEVDIDGKALCHQGCATSPLPNCRWSTKQKQFYGSEVYSVSNKSGTSIL
jgi:hypothetical protein